MQRHGGSDVAKGKETGAEDGFAFIDVMIVMTVVAICLLGLGALQVMSIANNRLGGTATRAYYIAQQYMEQALRADYTAAALADVNAGNNDRLMSTADTDARDIDVSGRPVDLNPFRLVWNIAADQPVAGTKTIAVIVTWDLGTRSRGLMSLKTRMD